MSGVQPSLPGAGFPISTYTRGGATWWPFSGQPNIQEKILRNLMSSSLPQFSHNRIQRGLVDTIRLRTFNLTISLKHVKTTALNADVQTIIAIFTTHIMSINPDYYQHILAHSVHLYVPAHITHVAAQLRSSCQPWLRSEHG